jgi:hypothetical protein
MPRKLDGTYIQTGSITTTQLSSNVTEQISAGGGPRVSSLIYPGDDTAANTVGGQTVYINGSGFETNNAIYINGNAVPSKSFISASNVSFTTPALSAGIYPVYFINTDTGATAIFVPGLTVSADPTWVTAAGSLNASQDETSAWSYSLSATGDDPITYALADGSSLPTGISLAANGVISGTLSSPPGTETTYTFSVVATDAQNQDSTRQFTVTTTSGEGVLFANNVLLIHADGTNNQNNHAFLDSSNNNFTITRYGNATQGSFSPFSQTGWSNYFDGNGDYLSFPSDAAFGFGTGDITIECWFYHTSRSTTATLFSNANDTLNLYINTSGVFGVYDGSVRNSSQTVPLNSWNHFAYVRSSGTAKLYYNGTEVLSFSSSTNYGTSAVRIGVNYGGGSGSDYATGSISNLRVVKGTALYTEAFTPSTTPLQPIANTSLLTCQSNRFIDNSTNNLTITRNGDTSIQAFSPFAPTAAYSTANVGGSGYFDGSGDYLTLPSNDSAFNCGADSFTLEFWYYDDGTSTLYPNIFGSNDWTSGVGGINIRYNNTGNANKFYVAKYAGNSTPNGGSGVNELMLTANTYAPKCWHHVAFVRNGNNFRIYVNGVKDAETTSTISVDWNLNSAGPRIGGGNWDGANSNIKAYVSGLRLIKGVALYTDNFTPPTAPLTNIANTSLLLNFTNAGIFDQTAKNVIETQSDAKISTSVYKYGTGSVYFDGTGDWLLAPSNVLFDIGGDFTIEMWFYATSVAPTYQGLCGRRASAASFGPFSMGLNGSAILFSLSTSGSSWALNSTGGTVTANTWNHVAFVRSGTSCVAYLNGTSVVTGTVSGALASSSQKLAIGSFTSDGSDLFTGYIDDFRFTRGQARYTSNFTPPTSALKDK